SPGTAGPQPGGQGQAAAGARGAVAEEMAGDRAGGDVGGVDPGAGHAGLLEGVATGGAQVEQPAAGRRRVGADEPGRSRAEGPGDGLVDVGTDLVAVRPDGGTDPGDDVVRARAQALPGG